MAGDVLQPRQYESLSPSFFPPADVFLLFKFIFTKLKPPLLDNSMVWVDGSPLDYNNWPNKSPDPKLLSADTCVTTRGVDGAWHLSQCTEQLGFVCKTTTGKLTHSFDFVYSSFIKCDNHMVRPWSNTVNTVLNFMPQTPSLRLFHAAHTENNCAPKIVYFFSLSWPKGI